MEDITMTAAQMMCSYGALGVCTLYFMFKDFRLNKQLTDALNDFTVALKVLTGKVED